MSPSETITDSELVELAKEALSWGDEREDVSFQVSYVGFFFLYLLLNTVFSLSQLYSQTLGRESNKKR
jgi:hypothetical protein